ncbi:anti-sigma F factor antagonist [uncultured Clostridium sp.]|uniref:anti-sigma F factor antagonist n=1 Tax=uncultured Clostridium sp. TaxID=59620 RepID=UPI002623FD84|nr:anti-sigma F factor antagonist [uncultured Clostridium sp.]
MYIDFKSKGKLLIVELSGELDHHSAQEVRTKVDDRLDRLDVKKLIFDFSEVSFMDSSGIGVIIGRYKKLSIRNGIVGIASVSGSIKRIFELSGIFKIIKVYKSVDEAVKNL